MLVAILTAMAPATLIVVTLIVLGVFLARLFETDEGVNTSGPWRFLGSIWLNVAILLLPLQRRRGAGRTPRPGRLRSRARALVGSVVSEPAARCRRRIRTAWRGLAAAGHGARRDSCSAEVSGAASPRRRRSIATLTLVVAALDARHWMVRSPPDLDVLLALYVVMLALLIGLGVSALENDLRQAGFGGARSPRGLSVTALIVAAVPFAAIFASGRFDLPTTSVAESLSTLAPSSAGVPRAVARRPVGAAPGRMVGGARPRRRDVDERTARWDLALHDARLGHQQRRLGRGRVGAEGPNGATRRLLAPAGISTIVVMNSSAPELQGVQTVPAAPRTERLVDGARRQSDLSLEFQTKSVEVFSNSLFHGIVSESVAGTTARRRCSRARPTRAR